MLILNSEMTLRRDEYLSKSRKKSKQTALLMNIKINNKVQFIKSSSKLNLLKKFEIIAKKIKNKKAYIQFPS